MTMTDVQIRELIEKKRELQAMYRHAARRAQDIRTRVLPPENESMRRAILARYNTEKVALNREINDIGEELWKLQKEREAMNNAEHHE